MKWIIISDDLQVRLKDGKPRYWSRQAVTLAQVIDAVSVWLETHDNAEADAWLEQADGELKKAEAALDLEKQITDYLYLDQLFEPDAAPEEARARAIAWAEFNRGREACRLGYYEKALAHLRPLAESGHPSACFYMGRICAKGAGVPQDYIKAYVWFDLAAKGKAPDPADKFKALVAERMSAEDLREAKRRTGERIAD